MTLEDLVIKMKRMNDYFDPAVNLPIFDRTGEPATLIDPDYVWNMATRVMAEAFNDDKLDFVVVIENAFPDEYYEDEMGEEIRNYVLELVCKLLGEKWFCKQDGKNAIFDRN